MGSQLGQCSPAGWWVAGNCIQHGICVSTGHVYVHGDNEEKREAQAKEVDQWLVNQPCPHGAV